MKKQLIIAALAVATSLSAFGQGYVSFASTKNQGAWYGPSSQAPGSAAALGNAGITVGFMWAAQGSVPTVGSSGTPTNSSVIPNWAQILGDPAFHFATNGSTLVSVAVNNSGLAQGGWGYNPGAGAGASFALAGSTAGATYTFLTVAWNSTYANPFLAAANSSFVGFSNPFNYSTGTDAGAAVSSFAASGQNAFGVQPIPEPATFALAGLGAAALLVFRRRK